MSFNGVWVSWSHTIIAYSKYARLRCPRPAASQATLNCPSPLPLSCRTDNASTAAFLGALLVGCSLHYRKIVKNAWFGYPDEWFPSVSATIGDEYPERSIFQLLIAITAGTNPTFTSGRAPSSQLTLAR